MHRYHSLRRLLLASATSALVAGAMAGSAPARGPVPTPPADGSANYRFSTLDNSVDPTFNQLLGINNSGLIAGYFGSGAAGHPNKGYLLAPPYGQGNYRNENFPGSAQTQVTGLNNSGITVGFWVDAKGNQSGFYARHHHFHTVDFPTSNNASPQVDQLLGVNDSGVAVGFFTDKNGSNHGYSYNIATHHYHLVHVAGDTNVSATAINDLGDIAGAGTNGGGSIEGFLRRSDGSVIHLDVPGAATTQALGVNDGDEVVGFYTVGTGTAAQTFGFVWAPGFGFQTINDPHGVGTTTLNGVNDRGAVVGFYTDATAAANVHGLLGTP